VIGERIIGSAAKNNAWPFLVSCWLIYLELLEW
jgi:hypothetical protein